MYVCEGLCVCVRASVCAEVVARSESRSERGENIPKFICTFFKKHLTMIWTGTITTATSTTTTTTTTEVAPLQQCVGIFIISFLLPFRNTGKKNQKNTNPMNREKREKRSEKKTQKRDVHMKNPTPRS